MNAYCCHSFVLIALTCNPLVATWQCHLILGSLGSMDPSQQGALYKQGLNPIKIGTFKNLQLSNSQLKTEIFGIYQFLGFRRYIQKSSKPMVPRKQTNMNLRLKGFHAPLNRVFVTQLLRILFFYNLIFIKCLTSSRIKIAKEI